MGLEISKAERERRDRVARLMGPFFSVVELPHRLIYSHGDTPRLPLATLAGAGYLPLRSDKVFVINPARTALSAGPR